MSDLSDKPCGDCGNYLYFGQALRNRMGLDSLRKITPKYYVPTNLGSGTYNTPDDDFIADLEETYRFKFCCHCNGRNS